MTALLLRSARPGQLNLSMGRVWCSQQGAHNGPALHRMQLASKLVEHRPLVLHLAHLLALIRSREMGHGYGLQPTVYGRYQPLRHGKPICPRRTICRSSSSCVNHTAGCWDPLLC